MKVQFLFAVLILACVALTQATYSTNELFARAAVEADTSSGVAADDVITHKDFSESEYDALQQLSEEEFWSHMDDKLQAHAQSFIEQDKAKKAKKAKKSSKKSSKKVNPAGLSDNDLAVAKAEGATPAEQKKPILDAKEFANDDPYEFEYAHHVIPEPRKTDSVTHRSSKYLHKVKKGLIAEGKHLYARIARIERKAKKYIDDEDWNNVKLIRRKLRSHAKKFKAWKLRKDTMDALAASVNNIIDWETASIATKSNLQKDYVKARDAKTQELRKMVDKYISDTEFERVQHVKAKAMKTLKADLAALKGKAMENFVQRYMKVLTKEFGKSVVDASVNKGGLRELRKLAGDKAGQLLLRVAAHLPTVGPYVRAGLISEKAGYSAYKFVSRW
jgi:hypothetical protein